MELRSSVERSARSGVIVIADANFDGRLSAVWAGTNEPAGKGMFATNLRSHPYASPSFAAMALRKWALRGVVAGGAGYAAYSFLKPVDAEHDFTGAAKKKRVGARDGPRPKLKREASSSRMI